LKNPALGILVSVFRSPCPNDELYHQYQGLTMHERPKDTDYSTMPSQVHDRYGICKSRVKIIETTGMTHMYITWNHSSWH
jgi:hypothetical protein